MQRPGAVPHAEAPEHHLERVSGSCSPQFAAAQEARETFLNNLQCHQALRLYMAFFRGGRREHCNLGPVLKPCQQADKHAGGATKSIV